MSRVFGPERGAVAVELALMLPVLILFLVVIVDLGLLLREHQIISNGAREGARFSSLPKNAIGPNNSTTDSTGIKQYVVNYCAEEGVVITASDVTVSQDRDIIVPGGQLKGSEIKVEYNRPVLFLGGFGSAPTVTLGSIATFSNLY